MLEDKLMRPTSSVKHSRQQFTFYENRQIIFKNTLGLYIFVI